MKLADLKKLCDEATPGPWVTVDDGFHAGVGRKQHNEERKARGNKYWAHADVCGGDSHEGYFTGPDADFIAAAREALPKLIAVAEAARSVLSEEGVREHFSGFVMGVELLDRLAALEADDA